MRHAIIISFAVVLGCQGETVSKSQGDYYTPMKMYDLYPDLLGEAVSIRGFLISLDDVLFVADREANSTSGQLGGVYVYADSETVNTIQNSNRCVDKYVEISGMIGEIPDLGGVFGLVDVFEIKVYSDETYPVDFEVCFQSDAINDVMVP